MNMKTVLTVALSLGASAAFAEPDKVVSVTRVGTNPSTAGPSSNFTGAVRVDSRFSATAPATVGGGTVTFEPGARTAWHTHPLGQTLIVTAGVWSRPALGRAKSRKSARATSRGFHRA